MEVRSENFDEYINKEKLVLVDFYAVWCGPCSMQKSILDKICKSRTSFNVLKVNIDEEEELARRFGIDSIPTLIVFKDGKQVEKRVGLHEENSIIQMMQKYEN